MNVSRLATAFNRADNIVWYEFLLDDEKLKKHLESESPEPNGPSLIQQFFDQANKPVVDQGQVHLPVNNLRTNKLKLLALKTCALMKWKLHIFEKELSTAMRHQMIRELMATCKVPVFPLQEDPNEYLEKMHDHSIISIVLYCLWILRTVLKDSFPTKPGGRTTPVPLPAHFQANVQQRADEIKEQFVNTAKESQMHAVQVLEAFLQKVKRPVFAPDYECLVKAEECGTGELKGVEISCVELHAQVCYDLACIYFMKGSYHKAKEHFGYVLEWLKQIPPNAYGFCHINEQRLSGYTVACAMCTMNTSTTDSEWANFYTFKDAALMENAHAYARANYYLKNLTSGRNSTDLLDVLREDIIDNELPMAFRDFVEKTVLKQMQSSEQALSSIKVILRSPFQNTNEFIHMMAAKHCNGYFK